MRKYWLEKITLYKANFSMLSFVPESRENGVQEAVSSTLATRTKQGPLRSAEKEPWNESFTVLFLCLCHKAYFHEIDLKGFFRSRIEHVLNNAKQLVFKRAVSASMVHGVRFFFLDFVLAKQKILWNSYCVSCTILLRGGFL